MYIYLHKRLQNVLHYVKSHLRERTCMSETGGKVCKESHFVPNKILGPTVLAKTARMKRNRLKSSARFNSIKTSKLFAIYIFMQQKKDKKLRESFHRNFKFSGPYCTLRAEYFSIFLDKSGRGKKTI